MKTALLLALSFACLAQSMRTDINLAQELSSHKDSTSACYCALTKSFSAAFFKSQKNEVWGTVHSPKGKRFDNAESGLYYYVEVRHIFQGEGDDSYGIMRSCDQGHCSKASGASQSNGTDVVAFLNQHKDQLRTEAKTKMRVTSEASQGWLWIVAGEDYEGTSVIPTILSAGDPDVVVAVYWTTIYGSPDTPIADRLSGWGSRFEPKDTQLSWGFEEVLDDPQGTKVQVTDQIMAQTASVPKGMVIDSKQEYTSLPSK